MLKNSINQIAYRKILITKDDKCEYCGKIGKLFRHHPDYNKPLEVILLCPKCHNEWHDKNKAIERIIYKKEKFKENITTSKINKSMILKFKGDKAEIHRQLKSFCALADKTLNGTVIEAIEQYLKDNKNSPSKVGQK